MSGKENLVVILRTSSPDYLMVYLIFATPNLMWTKIIVINKRCADLYSTYLLGDWGVDLGDVTGLLLQFSVLFLSIRLFYLVKLSQKPC